MSSPAETLAQEIAAGTYAPNPLVDCAASLPVDRSPQVIRLTQFTLFADPKTDIKSTDAPKYLILQQYETGPTHTRPKGAVDKVIGTLAAALGPGGATHDAAAAGSATRGTPARAARSSPRVARSATTTTPAGPDTADMLATLRRAGFAIDEAVALGRTDKEKIEGALAHIFLPGKYQPFTDPHPHIALLATFEQVWEPKGYTRGELITTIGLAPGEQLTLELHSWDKTIYKSQEELTTESALHLAETSNQRDSLTVARETASQTSMSLNVGATIPIKAVAVTLDGGVSNQVSKNAKSTAEQTQQRTADAAYSLKTSRKLNIEVSREIGREQKQTRVISNTNRCHSLSCHYFEIMSNYLVTTRLASLEPCLLVPTPRGDVTSAWVLCHESILKRALLDKAYLPGFDAARTLESESAYVVLQKLRGKVPSDFEPELKELFLTIGDAYKELDDNFNSIRVIAMYALVMFGADAVLPTILNVALATNDLTRLRQFLYFIILAGNRPVWRSLKRLYKERNASKPSHPLRAFLTMVNVADLEVTASSSAVAKGSAALGLPPMLIEGLIAWGFLDLVPDDAGLGDTLKAVAKRLDEIWSLPAEQGGGAPSGFSDVDVATAHANFEQLRCHIDDNWLHYAKAMWLDEDADSRFLRLQSYGAVASVLGNEVLGFLGHKEAFAVAAPAAITAVDFTTLIAQVKSDIAANPPEPWLVSLPTAGSVLETMVGECDACEDFIQESRLIDLRVQDAKASQEEAEAQRRGMRLAATPPDLSDPQTLLAGGRVMINVEGSVGSPETGSIPT